MDESFHPFLFRSFSRKSSIFLTLTFIGLSALISWRELSLTQILNTQPIASNKIPNVNIILKLLE